MSNEDEAKHAHAQVGALIDERRFREAVDLAGVVCRLNPDSDDGWWNFAVVLKHAHRWAECLEACDRAIALDPDNSGGVHWNAGISATALGDWRRARAAWTAYGIKIPDGVGSIEMQLGSVGVRISPDDQPEVVFAQRIDPCRARIVSVPTPESKHRYGDIVLHDGEARGKRKTEGGEVTVFDELMRLQPSTYSTWSVEVTCRGPSERDALLSLFEDVDGAIEDWTESLVMLCDQCSLGEPHVDHGHDEKGEWRVDRRLGLALGNERELRRLRRLGLWRRGVRSATRML